MEAGDLRRMKQFEVENQNVKRMLGDSMLDTDARRAAL